MSCMSSHMLFIKLTRIYSCLFNGAVDWYHQSDFSSYFLMLTISILEDHCGDCSVLKFIVLKIHWPGYLCWSIWNSCAIINDFLYAIWMSHYMVDIIKHSRIYAFNSQYIYICMFEENHAYDKIFKILFHARTVTVLVLHVDLFMYNTTLFSLNMIDVFENNNKSK